MKASLARTLRAGQAGHDGLHHRVDDSFSLRVVVVVRGTDRIPAPLIMRTVRLDLDAPAAP